MDVLLEEVKTYLKITWDDNRTNAEITALIEQANYYLLNKTGVEEIDYTEDLDAKSILKDYCRYVRNYSLEYFEENFASHVWSLILKYANQETT